LCFDDLPHSFAFGAAALHLLVAAWQGEMPVISHLCEKPHSASLHRDRDVEKIGLIGLVNSLLNQWLQFSFTGDEFEVHEEDMAALDGSDQSWTPALDVFSKLLEMTPHLGLCVIDGLNDLSFSDGASWCSAFLAMLFAHQRSSSGTFRILLTTSGQSRVLPYFVDVADRVFAQFARCSFSDILYVSNRNNPQKHSFDTPSLSLCLSLTNLACACSMCIRRTIASLPRSLTSSPR